MATRIGSPYFKPLNNMIKRMDASGVLNRIRNKYFMEFKDCKGSRVSSVGIEKMISIFAFLSGAVVLSFCFGIFELLYKAFKSNRT